MTNRFANSKVLLKQAEINAILDYCQLGTEYVLVRQAGAGYDVFEINNGQELYNKTKEAFDSNLLDYSKTNAELFMQLASNLDELSIHTSLSQSVKSKFSGLSWLNFSIGYFDCDKTAKETLDNLNERINELHEVNHEDDEYAYEKADIKKILKSIAETSKRYK